MENASRALTIVAGILLAILVTSLVIIGWGKISEFLSEREATKLVEDQAKFNEQLESYNRVIRGYDLVSLCNKIDDLNAVMSEADRYSDESAIPMHNGRYTETGYRKIIVFVQMNDTGGRLFGDNSIGVNTKEEVGKIKKSEIKAKYFLSDSENNMVNNAFTNTGCIYDLSKYMKFFNEVYAEKTDYATLKDDKKVLNDLYFTCKGVSYDSTNARVFMLLMKNIGKTDT